MVASLVLECFTLLWTPAKEASVPNLVPPDHLTTANSLSLVAAYGTMPIAAGLFSLLAGFSKAVGNIDALDAFRTNQEGLAFYVDAGTFLLSAFMISRLVLPKNERKQSADGRRLDFGQAFHELKEGWSFIFINPVVRAVNVGLATGLIGGGMLVPLGPLFSDQVLDAGQAAQQRRDGDHRAGALGHAALEVETREPARMDQRGHEALDELHRELARGEQHEQGRG